jgi:hypothetical protein
MTPSEPVRSRQQRIQRMAPRWSSPPWRVAPRAATPETVCAPVGATQQAEH